MSSGGVMQTVGHDTVGETFVWEGTGCEIHPLKASVDEATGRRGHE